MPRIRQGLAAAFALLTCFSGGAARADVELPVLAAPTPRVRVDGWLVEWPTNLFATVGGDPRNHMRIAFAPSDRGLYVAVSVDDDRMVRTNAPTPAEDAVVVTLASSADGTTVAATEIWLFAGVPNQTAASLTVGPVGGRAVSPRDADVVEMPTPTGYELEAFLPWSSLGVGRDYARYRAMARMHDVDQANGTARDVASVSAAAPDPRTLPPVVGTAGELYGFTVFLRDHQLHAADVELDVRANFSGDSVPERVFAVNGEIAIVGANYLGGRDFAFAHLGSVRGGITDLRAVDVDGDGHSELFLVARRADGNVRVAEARIFSFPEDRIQPMFRAEVAVAGPNAEFTSEWSFETVDRRPALRIRAATTTSAATRPASHVPQPDAVALLTASSGVASRLYAFASGSFGVVSEERVPSVAGATPPVAPTGTAAAGTARPTSGNATTTGTRANTAGATTAGNAAPTTTVRPSGFDPSSLYGVVRRERQLPDSTPPRFSTSADVVEDARPEVLCILGKSLVLVGPGYRSGMGYYAMDLTVPREDDVRSLTAQDVTGDGKAEIWVTVRQTIGAGPHWLDVLVIYRIDGQAMQPIFTAQIAFGDATREVRNEARVVGTGRSVQIALAPGRTQGFDAHSFPFTTTATPGMTTLLLPWRDREARYRWTGSAIVGP